jgi:hypothetical protein
MNIKKAILAVFAATLAASVTATAQVSVYEPDMRPIPNVNKAGDVGLGIIAGTPTALNIKAWTTENEAFNINAAYASGDLALVGDYLWHFRSVFSGVNDRPSIFVPYIGLGVMAIFNTTGEVPADRPLYRRTDNREGVGLGGRVPLGVEFLPYDFPAGFFAEVAPGAIFTPTNFSFVQAGVGARYYF